ncbi:undecaprenyl pyrophosphate synthetase [Kutzneria sp. 744]|nr:undecaprenyl pyrophosphate synthetase [Kutzneria sp. 744]
MADGPVPRHVGLIMDGNRRWARQRGMVSPSVGHRYGAEHVDDVLEWCRAMGIEHVTVFVCSTENLEHRGDDEVAYLMGVIEDVVAERLTKRNDHWRVHIAGSLDVLPDSTAHAVMRAMGVWCGVGNEIIGGAKPVARPRRCLDRLADFDRRHLTRAATRADAAVEIWQGKAPVTSGLAPRGTRGTSTVELPAVAERLRGAVLLRGLLAGLPGGGLPAGTAELRPATTASRGMNPRTAATCPGRLRWLR